MKYNFKKFKISKSYKAFSFAETIISIFVITIGLLAAVGLIAKTLEQSLDVKNQIIAGELAQEGAELVRNIRDNNWASNDSYGSFDYLPKHSNSNYSQASYYDCTIGYGSVYGSGPMSCGVSIPLMGLYNNFYGYYANGIGTITKFSRGINLIYPDANDLAAIVIVTWGSKDPSYFDANYSTNCNTSNKCTYTQVTLTTWGGN